MSVNATTSTGLSLPAEVFAFLKEAIVAYPVVSDELKGMF